MTGSLLIRLGSRISSPVIALWGCLLFLVLVANGCYTHSRGNPVDKYHYEHSITIIKDYSNLTIHTYINRSHLTVGFRMESLYDGNRDGELVTEGVDRVQITDYLDVEAPEEKAERIEGEIRNYDELFKDIIGAAKAGEKVFKIKELTYQIRFI